jgi:hypothetical protein
MSKDIEGIIEKFSSKFAKDGLLHDVNGPLDAQVVVDWLRTTLKSQADKYKREKAKAFVEGYGSAFSMCGVKITEEEEEKMISAITTLYGVDLSE